MKLAAPRLPKNWSLERREDGSAQATITRKPAGWALLLFIPFFMLLIPLATNGLLVWLMALTPVVALLVHLTDQVVHGALGTERWSLSKGGLNVRREILGVAWWNVDYFHGTLSVASEDGATWELRFHNDANRYALFHSDALDEVLGMAAFLEEELGWPLHLTESVPLFFRQLVEQALVNQDCERVRLLLQDERLIPVLAQVSRGSGPQVRSRLRETLSALEADATLLAGIVEHSGSEARAAAVELLGDLGEPGVLPLLRQALADPAGVVRIRAAEALGRLKDHEAVPGLCAALQYAPELRNAAARALGEIGDTGAVEALIQLLRSAGPTGTLQCRLGVLGALGRIKDAAAIPALCAALHDENPAIQDSAAQALGEIGGSEVVSALAEALSFPDEQVALRAAMALGRIRHPSALQALSKALASGRIELRASATQALAEIGDAAAVEELCRALRDTAAAVRYTAAVGLSRVVMRGGGVPIQVRTAIPLLRRMSSPFSTEPADVKLACRHAIQQIERCTARMKQLPLPAVGVAAAPAQLPLPADKVAAQGRAEARDVADATPTLQNLTR